MSEHLIQVDNLTKIYGKDFKAVDDISRQGIRCHL